MATKLNKIIKRELLSSDRKGRPFIMTVEPGDVITFRPKGSRRTVAMSIGFAITLAQIVTIDREYVAAMKKYKEDRSLGRRRRRPNKPALPFGKMYFEALK